MRIRISLLFLFFLPVYLPVAAQVKFTTVIDEKEIGTNDYLQVQYLVENAHSVEQITPPQFDGFTVVSGPNQQSNMSIINGAVTKSEGISFILRPIRTGRLTKIISCVPATKRLIKLKAACW
jgi:hypothetical protein